MVLPSLFPGLSGWSSSPYINRFLQPDTIIPGPANPQSWNRYSYVTNRPLMYSDPTGHKCNPDDGCETPHGDIIDPVSLTKKGDKRKTEDGKEFTVGYGGLDAYNMYLQYQQTDGWWNDYGNAHFGLAEFIGMWALFESAGDPKIAKVIATIIAQNLYNGGNNSAACSTGKCFNGALNFMASYSLGTTGMLNGGPAYSASFEDSYPKAFGDAAAKRVLLSDLGRIAPSRNSLDPEWTRETGPSNWGNVRDGVGSWVEAVRTSNIPEGNVNDDPIAANSIYYYNGNALFYSVAQKNWWTQVYGATATMAGK